MASSQPSPDTVITVKVSYEGVTRRSKMPLRDTAPPRVLEEKIRSILHIPVDTDINLERYSDSAAAYVLLDPANSAVYKQLYRAAKAKSKLKLRVTVNQTEDAAVPKPVSVEDVSEDNVATPITASSQKTPTSCTGTAPAPDSCQPTKAPAQPRQPSPPMSRVYDSTALAEAAKIAESADLRRELHARIADLGLGLDKKINLEVPLAPEELLDESANIPAIECARFAICCNSCEKTTQDIHYHCSTCDDGDFDLCQACVDLGITCHGSDHWLIKRTRVDGQIVTSTTETIAPKPKAKTEATESNDIPSFDANTALSHLQETMAKLQLHLSMRTCNSCIQERPEQDFLHCQTCEDFDLCQDCFLKEIHSHHPSHAFAPAVPGTVLTAQIMDRLPAGRSVMHQATCDNCDKCIVGVRHKCLECPDWDYCSDCIAFKDATHPKHRFVPVYDHLARPECCPATPVHVGICCDGPLCANGGSYPPYIRGVRYKCAVCHDVDFCANCEASPATEHNKSHPLIKFKTPVRHVSVTTQAENPNGEQMLLLGDRGFAPQPSILSINAPQTVVDTKPQVSQPQIKKEEQEEVKPVVDNVKPAEPELHAAFVVDEVRDGTIFGPNQVFEQTWHMRNSGEAAWPAGCSIKFVSGDYMGFVDSSRPARTAELIEASETDACESEVAPGEMYSFTVKLRTPPRPGKVVSYWRLTTPQGLKFGHRLWCDVNVRMISPDITSAAVKASPEPEKEIEKTELESSQMIFPKLEKESPMASVHEETAVKQEAGDDFEKCSKDDEWDGSDIDDFLTDEEYDILDASDEEFLEEQQKLLSK